MRTALLVCALAVVTSSYGGIVVAPAVRASLNLGVVGVGDRLLAREYLYKPAIVNTMQYQDLVYRGNTSVRISSIQANEVGYSQYASALLVSGGVGKNNATIRVQSARGYGYYYIIDIWGRYL